MSADPDRIAVPTNGRRPHAVPDSSPPPPRASSGGLSEVEMPVAFSQKQVAIGFGIVASLLLLLAGRARRRRSGD